MSDNCKIPHPLKRDGTSQEQRMPKALNTDYVKVDEKTEKDLLQQIAEYGRLLSYYDDINPKQRNGNWQDFFKSIYSYASQSGGATTAAELLIDSIDSLKGKGTLPPHLALLLAFVKMFQYQQKSINRITAEHLELYYRKILQLKARTEIADKVAVFFEPEKFMTGIEIPAGTYLSAGKDAIGKELKFKTTDTIVVNQGRVVEIKNVFTRKASGAVTGIFASPVSNSADGFGEKILDNPQSWEGFENNPTETNAQFGFAIASPLLNLVNGTRIITLSGADFSSVDVNSLQIELTTAKGWAKAVFTKPENTKLTCTLDTSFDAVVPYNAKQHLPGYNTEHPIMKVTLKSGANYAYEALKNVVLNTVDLIVLVIGTSNIVVQNNYGLLDHSKPFLPFGNIPKPGDTLYVGSYEAINKYTIIVALSSLSDTGTADAIGFSSIDSENLMDASTVYYYNNSGTITAGNRSNVLISTYVLNHGNWASFAGANPGLTSKYQYPVIKEFGPTATNGFIKLVLNTDLGYELYPTYLAKQLKDGNVAFPPMLPKINTLKIDYSCKHKLLDTTDEFQFFYLHPFGTEQVKDATRKLISDYSTNTEGQMILGLKGLQKTEALSIFFCMHEGSNNINVQPLPVRWEYLNNNIWSSTGIQISKDSTNNLTQSGIVKFSLPLQAWHTSTILSPDLIWIRAVTSANSAAHPKFIEISTQVVEAEYENNGNDTERLAKPLAPNTIKKFYDKIDGIKKINQPYSSYGGKTTESNIHYYERVSERLRHKRRAWSIWDYERLILEEFTYVNIAKCISHTAPGGLPGCPADYTEYAPGFVLLLCLPYISAVQAGDLLKPRISTGQISEIKAYISKLSSPFAHIEVQNPLYEEVRLQVDVAFVSGVALGDVANEKTKLIEKIKAYLAPWIVNNRQVFDFGQRIYRSEIINFIEEQSNVDYVGQLRIFKRPEGGVEVEITDDYVACSAENVILTSASAHIIGDATGCS